MHEPVTQPPTRTLDMPRLREAVARFLPIAMQSLCAADAPNRVADLATLLRFVAEGRGQEGHRETHDD